MKVAKDCLPCFASQAHKLAEIVTRTDADHAAFVALFMERLSELDLDQSPPAIAGQLYPLTEQFAGISDPYAEEKATANRQALALLPALRKHIAAADDPLRAALNIAIIGNYIDAGADLGVDWQAAVHSEADSTLEKQAYPAFVQSIAGSPKTLILGDNCGEIALDTLLVDALTERGCSVTYAVRGRPILNDATLEDAAAVGMGERCTVISSGVDTPGTVLERTTPEFRNVLEASELVISKGQGNFEALYENRSGIYFAFKAKCRVVAKALDVPQGTSMFMYA